MLFIEVLILCIHNFNFHRLPLLAIRLSGWISIFICVFSHFHNFVSIKSMSLFLSISPLEIDPDQEIKQSSYSSKNDVDNHHCHAIIGCVEGNTWCDYQSHEKSQNHGAPVQESCHLGFADWETQFTTQVVTDGDDRSDAETCQSTEKEH